MIILILLELIKWRFICSPPIFHPTQFATLHSVITLAFPISISGMSCEVFTPENQRPQNSPPPFNGAGKNKGAFPHGHCACSRFVSLIQPFRSYLNYTISFVHLSSFSTPRVSVSCLNTHTFPTHNNSISTYFYLRIVCPIKPVPVHCRFVQPELIVSSCY